MKKIVVLMLASMPMLCFAAGKSASATMQVSFTVVEACTVEGAANGALVSCAQQTPYQIQARPAASAAASAAAAPLAVAAKGDPVTIYF